MRKNFKYRILLKHVMHVLCARAVFYCITYVRHIINTVKKNKTFLPTNEQKRLFLCPLAPINTVSAVAPITLAEDAFKRSRYWIVVVIAAMRFFILGCLGFCIALPVLAEPDVSRLMSSRMNAASHTIHSNALPVLTQAVPVRPASMTAALVFISFSMPAQHINALLRQAKHYQIPVILNGVINHSLNQTLAKIFSTNRTIKASILIDPNLFRECHITRVPSLVVFHSTSTFQPQKNHTPSFDVIAGEMSIRSMLEAITLHGDEGKAMAQHILDEEKRSTTPP